MSDKTDVWMPLYVGDYLADTQHLTCEQHGAYFLLMMFYWRHGSLPNDDAQLASIAKISAHKWKKISPIIRKFFHDKGDALAHKRIDKELAQAAENKEKRQEKARRAAAARWENEDAPSMPGECPSPSPSSVEPNGSTGEGTPPKDEPAQTKPKAKTKLATRLPEDWTLPDEWRAWAIAEGMPRDRVAPTADKFRDYWLGAPGAKGRKNDWLATWRNWVRRDLEDKRNRHGLSQGGASSGGGFAGQLSEMHGYGGGNG